MNRNLGLHTTLIITPITFSREFRNFETKFNENDGKVTICSFSTGFEWYATHHKEAWNRSYDAWCTDHIALKLNWQLSWITKNRRIFLRCFAHNVLGVISCSNNKGKRLGSPLIFRNVALPLFPVSIQSSGFVRSSVVWEVLSQTTYRLSENSIFHMFSLSVAFI